MNFKEIIIFTSSILLVLFLVLFVRIRFVGGTLEGLAIDIRIPFGDKLVK
jgi:hypothetical protein